MLRRREVNTDVQRKIITGLIVSTKFCREVLPMIQKDYFSVPYAREVIRWVNNYFNKYQEAPSKHIQDIYDIEKEKMSNEMQEMTSTFLISLSQEYERAEHFNVDYLHDEAVKYFRGKALELHAKEIKVMVAMGKHEEAEEKIRDYKQVTKSISSWVNPFDPDFVDKVFEEREETFFRIPGKLGELVGNLERGFLVLVCAPVKRGKSFMFQEMAVIGILNNLNTVFISAEMSKEKLSQRIFKRLTALGDREGDHVFPVFDCYKNQDGSCRKRERANKITLLEDGRQPEFRPRMRYKVCTYCREKGGADYESAVWYESKKKGRINPNAVKKKVKALERMHGSRLRVMAYPRFSASVADIERDLDNLVYMDNFVPDLIITDYADIFKPSDKRLVGRDALDAIYKEHAAMASMRHALVFTGSQSNRASMDKKNVRSTDIAEDIRKLAHMDVAMFLSQTSLEKKRGIMRVSVLLRHDEFQESRQIQILQSLDIGAVLLDSAEIRKEKKDVDS